MRARKEIEKEEGIAGEEWERNRLNLEVLLDIRAVLLNVNKLLVEQKKIAIGLLEHRGSIKIT